MNLKVGLFLSSFLFLSACGGAGGSGGSAPAEPDAGQNNPPAGENNNPQNPDDNGQAPGNGAGNAGNGGAPAGGNGGPDPGNGAGNGNNRPVVVPVNPNLGQAQVDFGIAANVNVKIFRRNADATLTEVFSEQTDESGNFSNHASDLEDGTIYLYQAEGGFNLDANGDGVAEVALADAPGAGAENKSLLRLVASGADIKRASDIMRISYLSELVYESVAVSFVNPAIDADALMRQINGAAALTVTDINGDNVSNAIDVLDYSPRLNENALTPLYRNNLNRINTALQNGYPAVLAMDSIIANFGLHNGAGARDIRLARDRTRAYLALGGQGLEIVDISDPAMPRSLSNIDTVGQDRINISEIAVNRADTIAYAADPVNGRVYVVDVSDAENARIVRTINDLEGATDIVLTSRENQLYITAANQRRLYVVDAESGDRLTNFELPIMRNSAHDVQEGRFEGQLFVAAGTSGVLQIDVSDADRPRISDEDAQDGVSVQNIFFRRNSGDLYTTGTPFLGDGGFQIMQSNPLRHEVRDRLPAQLGIRTTAINCATRNSGCWIAFGQNLLLVDQLNAHEVENSIHAGVNVNAIALSEDESIAFLATDDGLRVIALNRPDNSVLTDVWFPTTNPSQIRPGNVVVSEDGNLAYVAHDTFGLYTLNTSNPFDIAATAREDGRGYSNVMLGVQDGINRLYGISNNEVPLRLGAGTDTDTQFAVLGLNTPSSPNFRGQVELAAASPQSESGLAASASGDFIFTSGNDRLLTSVDVRRPRRVAVQQQLGLGENTRQETGRGAFVLNSQRDTVYFVLADGYQVVDVTDPTNMIAGERHTGLLNNAAGRNAKVLITADDSKLIFLTEQGVTIVDISDAEAPETLATINLGRFVDDLLLSADDQTLYASRPGTGIEIIDISNASDPVLRGALNTRGYNGNMFLTRDNKLYFTSRHLGLQVHDIGALLTRH